MTFMEAEAKLAEMANGRYHSLNYELTTYTSGERRSTVRIYIDGMGSLDFCRTWEFAFLQLKNKNKPDESIEELPGEVPESVEG